MRIYDIIIEDAEAGTTMAGNFASVSFPMTPGTSRMASRLAVDPHGYLNGKKKKKKVGYVNSVNESIYEPNPEDPMNPTILINGYGTMSLNTAKTMITRELKELVKRAELDDMENVQYILKHAPLMSKIDAVVAAFEELEQRRRRGGKNSRGIVKR